MPIPRLDPENTALLVIDLQERLVPSIVDRGRIINNCSIMLKLMRELNLPFLVTEHYPRGLGRTVEAISSSMLDPSARIEKTRFSALVEVVDDLLQSWRRTTVLVCGIEAHVCVLQTVLDLQASGRQAFVVSDAVSAAQRDQIGPALRRMDAAGAVVTGVMSAMYELLGDANHPSRRACVELAKSIEL